MEHELEEVVAVLAVFAFPPLPSEGIYELTNRSHGDPHTGIDFPVDFLNGEPGATLEIEHPELVKVGFFRRGAAIN